MAAEPIEDRCSRAEGDDPHELWERAQQLRGAGDARAGARLELSVLSRFLGFADAQGRLDRINKWRGEGFPEFSVELARQLLDQEGEAMELLFALAMALLKTGDLDHARSAYRRAVEAEGFGPKNAERFGIELQRVFGYVGDFDTAPHVGTRLSISDAEEDSFVYVLGNSQVRTLAYDTGLFPLYIGGGGYTNFLFEEKWRLTVETVECCVERIETSRDVLLVFGAGDVNNYRRFGDEIRAEPGGSELTPREILERSARRYAALIERLRIRLTGRLFVLSTLPTFDREQTEVAHAFNAVLRAYCVARGVHFLDIVDYVSDPESGLLATDMAIAEDDAHLHQNASKEILTRLRAAGARMARDSRPFNWNYLFQFPLNERVIARVWSEPDTTGKNVVYLRLVGASQMISLAAAIVSARLFTKPARTVVAANCGEGLFPLYLPLGSAQRIVGLPESSVQCMVAERLRRFAGRSDIEFLTDGIDLFQQLGDESCLGVLLCLEGMDEWHCRALLETMMEACDDGLYVVVNGGMEIEHWIKGRGRIEEVVELGNRFAAEEWRSTALLRVECG